MKLEEIKEDYEQTEKGRRIAININPIAVWKAIRWWKNRNKQKEENSENKIKI